MAARSYHGRYEQRTKRAKRRRRTKLTALLVSLILIFALGAGGTMAILLQRTDEAQNVFQPTAVTCQVNTRALNDTIDVTNTSVIPAYIRAVITVNWVDDNGDVRGLAPTPADYALVTGTENWIYNSADGFYYYTVPVAPGQSTAALVTGVDALGDIPDGYRLGISVAAEAIQADGDTDDTAVPAYRDAWGVSFS